MAKAELSWEYDVMSVHTLEELDTALVKLHKEALDSGYSFFGELFVTPRILMMSFSGERSCVRYYDLERGVGAHSVGTNHNEGVEIVFYKGHWSEVDKKEFVSYDEAHQAMRLFFISNEKPDNIEWLE